LAHSFKGETADSLRSRRDNSLPMGRQPTWLSFE